MQCWGHSLLLCYSYSIVCVNTEASADKAILIRVSAPHAQ